MNNRVKGPLLIVLTAILWSFAGILIKLIPWDAMTIISMRSIFAAAVTLVYMRRFHITMSPAVILGGLSMSATTVLFVFANKLTTAANAIVLQYTAPVFVVIFSFVFLKKRAKAFDFITVIIAFAGIALFFFDKLKADAMLGNILACLSGITFTGVFLANKMKGNKPEESVLLGHIINAVVGFPFIFNHITFEPTAWIAIVLLGVFQLGLAYVVFSIGIKLTSSISASLIAMLEPLLNPFWVLLIMPERPGIWALTGGGIVLVTVVVYTVISARNHHNDILPEDKNDSITLSDK
jgi:drug/metabolite transporter (DMT)-like permease